MNTYTLRELLDLMAELHPVQTFLISPESNKQLTFGELREQSRIISLDLLHKGLQPGDKVAFLLDNGLFAAQLFLATMYGGFVAVPLNVRAGASQLSYTLDHCDAKVVFVSEEYNTLIEEVMANVARDVRVIPEGVDFGIGQNERPTALIDLAPPEPEDPALLMYTSGSTGQPKAAVHSHRTILAGANNSVAAHQLTSSDRSLLVLPLYHINAECVTLIPTLMSGGSVVVPQRFSVSQFWDWLDDYRCTWSAVVPTIISQLLDWQDPRVNDRGPAFQRIRFLRSSSAPLAPSLHREFLDRFPLLLIQAMGSSEGGNIFSNPLPPGKNKIGSPGLPWGFETRIINREGLDVSRGESGEMLIRGPAMTRGYYKQPEETDAVFDAEGWLHTGDLAYQDEDGYFFVVGRSKELIIKGGVNIAPRQIDDVLESHPAVLEAAAIGVPDHYMGEDLAAFVVLRAGVTVSESELLSFCEGRLGHFKTPTRIYFANDLPKGPSGKVQRLRLLDQAKQPVIVNASSPRGQFKAESRNGQELHNGSDAASALEKVIAEAWAEVLCRAHVDPDGNFFALGGHSLLAVQCVSLLRNRIPVSLSLSDFFENATVAQQAELVIRRLHQTDPTSDQALVDQSASPLKDALQNVSSSVTPSKIPLRDRTIPCPLSPAQLRLWFMERLNPGVPVYNEAEAVRLMGELNVDAMEGALNIIVDRHDILRTTIHVKDSEPAAVVHPRWPIQLKKIELSALAIGERQAETDRLLTDEPRRPYHLETEPGIRATLLYLGPQEHVLILMMHHIICDWSSEGVLWRELANLYRMLSRGEEASLSPLTIQHGDYAAWQVEQNTDANFAEDLVFWEQKLRGAPQLLELPADRTRPPTLSHRGARQRFVVNSTLTKALRDLGQRAETTLFSVFAAALNTLLYRYTGQEDILIGIPIADRDRMELQQLIGFLLHTQVLRTELSGDMTFRKLLARVQKAALELYLHRAVPFDRVVRRIQPERNLSYSPLFQVMLNWRDRDQLLSFIGLEGLVIESLLAESRTSKFDLTLFATDCGNEIWLEMEYSTDLFDDARITRMLGHFQTVLESVVADPDERLAELPLLTSTERRLMLEDWNRTDHEYPRDRMLHELIEAQVERTPDAVAVVFEDQHLTYRQLNDRANSLAQDLQGLGVGPNVLVAICVERSLEMMVGLLAVLKAGGAYVPLDPAYPKARLDFILEDAQARVVLTQHRLRPSLEGCNSQIICLDTERNTISKAGTTNPSSTVGPNDLAYVIYTSGSTGQPKGVAISHRSPVAFVHWAHSIFSPEELAGVLFSTSICFDLSVFEMFAPLTCGGKVVLVENGLHLREAPSAAEVTLINTVPSVMKELLLIGAVPSSVLTINLAGEPLPTELVRKIYELEGVRKVYDLYGPSETTTYSTCALRQVGGPCTIGRPIGNTKIYILDSGLQPVPVGVTGELCIAGDGLACGYLNRPELTAEKFIASPCSEEPGERLYRTGDLARYLPDGNIEFLGRMDHQVKVRGFRIELGEVEAALKQHPSVDQCLVLAREDSRGDKRLEAYIVPISMEPSLRTSEFREFVRQKLPEYMVPSAFGILDCFPLTPNGKVDRKALTSAYESELAQQPSVHPQTQLELHLQKIWERVLDVGNIGVRDNFFDLGGHSLLAVRLINDINKELSVSLADQPFFLNPTIEGIAKVLLEGRYAGRGPQLMLLRQAKSQGSLFFVDATMAVCRLAQLLDVGPAVFATEVPLTPAVYRAAVLSDTLDMPHLGNLAAAHAKLILSQQPSGPCLLAGHSFNGLLAVEVAHQLREQGIQVETILMLDSLLMISPLWYRLKALSWARARSALTRRVGRLWREAVRMTKRIFPDSKSQLASELASEQIDHWQFEVPFETLKRIYNNAFDNYQWRPLESRGIMCLAQEGDDDPKSRSGQTLANMNKLRRLFRGGIEIVKTPGDHRTMLEEPNLSILARKVNQFLAPYSSCSSRKPEVLRAYESNPLPIVRPVSNHMALEESEIK